MMNSLRVAAVAAVVAALPFAAQAQQAGHGAQGVGEQAVRNVVLVHGAFADGSGWRGVYDDLTRRGYRVTIVQNPLTSLADDVAATKRALARQDGPAILVGHSWAALSSPKPASIRRSPVSSMSPPSRPTRARRRHSNMKASSRPPNSSSTRRATASAS